MKTLLLAFTTLLLLTAVGFADESADDAKGEAEKVEKADATAEKVVAEDKAAEKPAKKADIIHEMITTESGLRYEDVVIGTGTEATPKMALVCHYTVWFADESGLKKTGKLQSSKDKGLEFNCRLGQGLIAGWSEGMVGMKEGGTRVLYVPWQLGWGDKGMGSQIPPKQNVIFEIDFIRETANRKLK